MSSRETVLSWLDISRRIGIDVEEDISIPPEK